MAPQSSPACRATSWWRDRTDWTGQGTTVALGPTSAARPIGPSIAYPSMPTGRWGRAAALPASDSSRLCARANPRSACIASVRAITPLRVGGGSSVSESVISVSELTRRFGATTALDAVTLALPRGAVYGLVGANGAGKPTLIKHILGLLRAESGSVRVFGLDPVADPVGVLARIGYLSEQNDLPGWMRVDELINYSRAFYPSWDD